MPEQKDNTPELLRFPNPTSGRTSASPITTSIFNFGQDEDTGPEMELVSAAGQAMALPGPAPLTDTERAAIAADRALRPAELPANLDVQAHQQRVSELEPAARALHDYWLAKR